MESFEAEVGGVTRRRGSRALALIVAAGLFAGLVSQALAAAGDTVLVSRASDGTKGNGSSDFASTSADGRFVVFRSSSTNLDPADTDTSRDIFLRDVETGTTTLVSRASGAGGAKGNSASFFPSISADGRFVAFQSAATNLDPADTDDFFDIFVRDLETNTTTLVSRASGAGGAKGNSDSRTPSISADGRFVAFESIATNLDPADTDNILEVLVRDLQTNTTTLVSRATGATGAKGNSFSSAPSISGDGRFVAFASNASNLDPADSDSAFDIFVRDLQANTTMLASRATGATGAKSNGISGSLSISDDGRFVALTSTATNLDSADTDSFNDVFVRDLEANTTTLASRANGADGAKGGGNSATPSISGDGRFVAFTSTASNLDSADTDTVADIFVRDVVDNTTTLASRATGATGAKGNGISSVPSISADGRFVAFSSSATTLDPDDTGTGVDIYRRELFDAPGATVSIDGSTLLYDDLPDQVNNPTLSYDGTDLLIDDATMELTAGPGCAEVDADTVSCDATGVDSYDIHLHASGGAQESFTAASLSPAITTGVVRGGPGPDAITGGGADETLQGGLGADNVDGGMGADRLNGGPGADADVIDGGGGNDRALYVQRTDDLELSLDGVANDGVVGENDNLLAIEVIRGGAGDDTLTGDGARNSLIGGPGADTFFGMGGNDFLNAGDGEADLELDCGAGNDRLASDGTDPSGVGCER